MTTVGLGAMSGVSVDDVLSAVDAVLPAGAVGVRLATLDVRAAEPGVREAAVIGVDDEEYGQRLAAYLVLEPGASVDADAVRDHVKTNLARFASPRDVEFLDELPKTTTGKILRRELRASGA